MTHPRRTTRTTYTFLSTRFQLFDLESLRDQGLLLSELPLSTPALFNFDGFLRTGVGDPRQVQLAVKLTF